MSKTGGIALTILVSDRLSNSNGCFLVRVLQDHNLGQLNTQSESESASLFTRAEGQMYLRATAFASSG